MIDPEARCLRCGRVMKCQDDYAHEGYVEGYYYECQGEACQAAAAAAESAYWASFDVEAMRAAFDPLDLEPQGSRS